MLPASSGWSRAQGLDALDAAQRGAAAAGTSAAGAAQAAWMLMPANANSAEDGGALALAPHAQQQQQQQAQAPAGPRHRSAVKTSSYRGVAATVRGALARRRSHVREGTG